MTPYMEMKLMAEAAESNRLEVQQKLDRVTAERDAALGREASLREENLKVRDMHAKQCCVFCNDTGNLRSVNAELQQRLTAADERADMLEGFLRTSIIAMKRIYQAGYDRIIEAGGTCDTPEYMMESDPTVREIGAALKPAEGGGDEA